MDRINKFLAKRPTKHKKILHYNGDVYEVTKADLKTVRAYRSRKCLDESFVLTRPPDLRFSSTRGDPLPAKEKSDCSAVLLHKAKRYYELHPVHKRIQTEKNAIVDAWENDTRETLQSYVQEWVYSIKDQYNMPIEQCAFTREHLETELRRVFLQQFRPREVKDKSISQLLPKIPDAAELRPFPEQTAKTWRVEGKKYLHQTWMCSVVDNTLSIVDLLFNKSFGTCDLKESICAIRFDENSTVYASTTNTIYRIDAAKNKPNTKSNDAASPAVPSLTCTPISESKQLIRDFYVSNGAIAILTSKVVNLYRINGETLSHEKKFVAKYENPHRVKIFNGAVHVSTANGLLIEAEAHGDVKSLNYVIDFACKNDKLYVINNLNRLIVIAGDGCIKKNIVQPQMGKVIKVHAILNMLAIMFSEEIGIYKYVDGEYVPVNTLTGRFKNIEWHPTMPWLYAGKNSKAVLYT